MSRYLSLVAASVLISGCLVTRGYPAGHDAPAPRDRAAVAEILERAPEASKQRRLNVILLGKHWKKFWVTHFSVLRYMLQLLEFLVVNLHSLF